MEGKTLPSRKASGLSTTGTTTPRLEEGEGSCAVRVAIRVRPLSSSEIEAGCTSIVSVEDGSRIAIRRPKYYEQEDPANQEIRRFNFDRCYLAKPGLGPGSQLELFQDLGTSIVNNAFEGFNCSLFAYGQTGSGKTHTMTGGQNVEEKGLIPRICEAIFERSNENRRQSLSTGSSLRSSLIIPPQITTQSVPAAPTKTLYQVHVSYCEIYLEKVKDLLWTLNPIENSRPADSSRSERKLRVREHPASGPYVEGLTVLPVTSYEEVERLLAVGTETRTVAATMMNAASSRSHAIFTITFIQTAVDPTTSSPVDKVSRINLIDLAGSERADTSGTSGDRLKEASTINKSLTTLGRVISTLGSVNNGGKGVVPYRDSVLTWLLKESLGGNAKTTMISTISPADKNYEETLSTLRYADSAKRIVNRAVINEDPNAKIIRQLRDEVEKLKQELKIAQELANRAMLEPTAAIPQVAPPPPPLHDVGDVLNPGTIKLSPEVPALVNLEEELEGDSALVYYLRKGVTKVSRKGVEQTNSSQAPISSSASISSSSSSPEKSDCLEQADGAQRAEMDGEGNQPANTVLESTKNLLRKFSEHSLSRVTKGEGEGVNSSSQSSSSMEATHVIELKNESIAAQHCQFLNDDMCLSLLPLEGTVTVDGEDIKEKVRLYHGQRVALGSDLLFRVHAEGSAPTAPLPLSYSLSRGRKLLLPRPPVEVLHDQEEQGSGQTEEEQLDQALQTAHDLCKAHKLYLSFAKEAQHDGDELGVWVFIDGRRTPVLWKREQFLQKISIMQSLLSRCLDSSAFPLTPKESIASLLLSPREGRAGTPVGDLRRNHFRRHHSGLVSTPKARGGGTPRIMGSAGVETAAEQPRVFSFSFMDSVGEARGEAKEQNLSSSLLITLEPSLRESLEHVRQLGAAYLSLSCLKERTRESSPLLLSLPVLDVRGQQIATVKLQLSGSTLDSQGSEGFSASFLITEVSFVSASTGSSALESLYLEEIFLSYRFWQEENASYTSSVPCNPSDASCPLRHDASLQAEYSEELLQYLDQGFLSLHLWGRGLPVLPGLPVSSSTSSSLPSPSGAPHFPGRDHEEILSGALVHGSKAKIPSRSMVPSCKIDERAFGALSSVVAFSSSRFHDFFLSVDVRAKTDQEEFLPVPVKDDGSLRLLKGRPLQLVVTLMQSDHEPFSLESVEELRIGRRGKERVRKNSTKLLGPLSLPLMGREVEAVDRSQADGKEFYDWQESETLPISDVKVDKQGRSITVLCELEPGCTILRGVECQRGERQKFHISVAFKCTSSALPVLLSRPLVAKVYTEHWSSNLRMRGRERAHPGGRKRGQSSVVQWEREEFTRMQHLGSWFTVEVLETKEASLHALLSTLHGETANCDGQTDSGIGKKELKHNLLKAMFERHDKAQKRLYCLLQLENERQSLLNACPDLRRESGHQGDSSPSFNLTSLTERGVPAVQGKHGSVYLQCRSGWPVFQDLHSGALVTFEERERRGAGDLLLAALPDHQVNDHGHSDADAGDMCGFLMLKAEGSSSSLPLTLPSAKPTTRRLVGGGGTTQGGDWKRRWVVLKRPFLYIYKEYSKGKAAGVLDISRYQVVVDPADAVQGIPFSFWLASSSSSPSSPSTALHQFQASTQAEQMAWVVALDPLRVDARVVLQSERKKNEIQITAPLMA